MTVISAPAPAASVPAPTPYTVSLAVDETEVRAAQRLRHDVFAPEMGARLTTTEPGHDIDAFDAYCDHLLVRERATGEVVGTYRLLPPERARVAGRLYADSEFDLSAQAALRSDLVEVGRSCVHPAHRDGAVIALMWAGIAAYLTRSGHNWLAGCCSLPLADGGAYAADVCRTVTQRHLAPPEHRVAPRLPWHAPETPSGPASGPDTSGAGASGAAAASGAASGGAARNALPPLLRGYLRLGAKVCGPPAYDPDFHVADLYVLLSLRDTNPRYLRHFLSLVPA
ncbi:GNAT family N-acetyltransferase [Streptomyces armeniacus]|uniref:GNAT family N-acetyltransferase n=1 Tax=Streptomyces armeniacus TaxID=83291 RepID=A0A345XLP6_9ACTN|nr:GNAT family N-acyltransferase [Streptomyces armeniacus]AXK32562.1 GNAT family N-acetyltransferase [Streptomyces armeniacus]